MGATGCEMGAAVGSAGSAPAGFTEGTAFNSGVSSAAAVHGNTSRQAKKNRFRTNMPGIRSRNPRSRRGTAILYLSGKFFPANSFHPACPTTCLAARQIVWQLFSSKSFELFETRHGEFFHDAMTTGSGGLQPPFANNGEGAFPGQIDHHPVAGPINGGNMRAAPSGPRAKIPCEPRKLPGKFPW